jgi:hypothetical protein
VAEFYSLTIKELLCKVLHDVHFDAFIHKCVNVSVEQVHLLWLSSRDHWKGVMFARCRTDTLEFVEQTSNEAAASSNALFGSCHISENN